MVNVKFFIATCLVFFAVFQYTWQVAKERGAAIETLQAEREILTTRVSGFQKQVEAQRQLLEKERIETKLQKKVSDSAREVVIDGDCKVLDAESSCRYRNLFDDMLDGVCVRP